MLQDLERLVELQKLDTEIAQLDGAMATIPGQIRILEQHLAQARTVLEAATVEVERLQKLRRQKERDLDEAGRELKKRQGRLYEIKTNQEYAATLKEVEGLKQKISQLEEEILMHLDEIDEAVKIRNREQEKVRIAEVEFLKNKQEREDELRKLQGRLTILRKTRGNRSEGVESSLLQLYLKLLKSRDGLAVANVAGRSCEGCHVAITPQLYNEVRRNTELHTCEGCGRLLHWKG